MTGRHLACILCFDLLPLGMNTKVKVASCISFSGFLFLLVVPETENTFCNFNTSHKCIKVCVKILVSTFMLWKGIAHEESVSVWRQKRHGVIKTGKITFYILKNNHVQSYNGKIFEGKLNNPVISF